MTEDNDGMFNIQVDADSVSPSLDTLAEQFDAVDNPRLHPIIRNLVIDEG